MPPTALPTEGHAHDAAEAEDADVAEAGVDPELELPADPASGPRLRYTADLSDEALARLWSEDPAQLGPMSLGTASDGRLINGVRFPSGGPWEVVAPENAWATQSVVEQLSAAIREVDAAFPNRSRIRVGHISAREGGRLRPHRSHQTGRDVDLSFYYKVDEGITAANRERHFDVERNWALLRALVTHGDVQLILVDRRIQKLLITHARKIGEDPAWLDALFHRGTASIVRHARRHRDHFHVRYLDGRAQELGRRVTPLLAKRPEHNLVSHTIRRGETLGSIARRYGTSVELIRRRNQLQNAKLRAGQALSIPLRGPCTSCPIPPEVIVPARKAPPDRAVALAVPYLPPQAAGATGGPRDGRPSQELAGGGAPSAFGPSSFQRCTRSW